MQVGNILPEKINSAQKKKKSSGSVFSVASDAEEAGSGVSIGKVNVSSLWTLQTMDDDVTEREKFQHSCKDVIEELKSLRLGLINNDFSQANISKLTEVLKNSKLEFQDPEMQKLLDDVRLRAEIELAKLERAQKSHS